MENQAEKEEEEYVENTKNMWKNVKGKHFEPSH